MKHIYRSTAIYGNIISPFAAMTVTLREAALPLESMYKLCPANWDPLPLIKDEEFIENALVVFCFVLRRTAVVVGVMGLNP